MARPPFGAGPATVSSSSAGIGIAIKIASTCCMAVMFSIVKIVSPRLPPGEIVFMRSLVSALLILGVIWCGRDRLGGLRTSDPWGHLTRSLLGASSMFLAFIAISSMPLASASAISFTTPIMITLLAVLVLREAAGPLRWVAVGTGIAGVLVIMWDQLQLDGDNPALPLGVASALLSAMLAAAAMIALRRIAAREPADRIAFYFMFIAMLMGLASLPFGWSWPLLEDGLLLLVAGIVGGLGQFLMSLSYRYAQASVLAPFDYLNLLWLTLIGALLLSEPIGPPFYAGAALIIAGGLLVALERRRPGGLR